MSSSRWGSFLQQAVAGVESRLDNILGEAEDGQQPPNTGAQPPLTPAPTVKPTETAPPRKPISNPANDRLQERLARAIAAKNKAAANSNSTPSRTGSPVTATGSPRTSLDAPPANSQVPPLYEEHKIGSKDKTEEDGVSDSPQLYALATVTPIEGADSSSSPKKPHEISPRLSLDSSAPLHDKRSYDLTHLQTVILPDAGKDVGRDAASTIMENGRGFETTEPSPLNEASRQPSKELERYDEQRQQELHEYVERIDALQAKLLYLSRETAESARKAASSAPVGSIEKKMAEKDEQIAALMEEGQKLSKTELKHMTVIKKLRMKVTDTEKETLEHKKRAEKFEKEKSAFAERLRRIDSIEKQSAENQKALVQAQKEIAAITSDRDAKIVSINQLKVQLQEAASQAKAEEVKAMQLQLEQERSKVSNLENDLSSLKIENELAAGRAKAQLDELRGKGEREAERARIVELEMKAEQQILESRLEVLRTRAEEVSSGATSDAQAKLLRQIETLQSQHAIAGENWQRIEASLSSRATNLEKEKDEALKKEAEVRRKAREMNLKTKRMEEEVEELRIKTVNLEGELLAQKEALEKFRKRAEDAETALIAAQNGFEQDKQALTAELQNRIEEDKSRWREQSSYTNSRAESPVASTHRSLTAEYLGLQNLQTRRASARSITEAVGADRHLSRRSSALPGVKPGSGRGTSIIPMRQDSQQSLTTNGEGNDDASMNALDQDDYFENIVTPSSPHDKMQDLVSISTVGAGPSVQLVERMSAAVRRLETEKVSNKEELARLSAQRDEARAEIVTLMQEVEVKRSLDSRIKDLEEENTKINARYQTTLEMLGEKSELVEELKADVQDVKDMYRELVERTVQ